MQQILIAIEQAINSTKNIVTIERDFLTTTIPTAAYIHIPFCRRRCYYCDFPSAVVGDNAVSSSNAATMVEEYLLALKNRF